MFFNWSEKQKQNWQEVEKTAGRTIRSVYLIVYTFQDEEDWTDTLLELHFTDDSVLFLTSASDGESLHAADTPWQDPFANALNKENEEFIRTHGRWMRRDVSGREPFSRLISTQVSAVHPIFNEFGTLCGAQLVMGDKYLSFVVEGDECDVLWGKDNPVLEQRGYTVVKGEPHPVK